MIPFEKDIGHLLNIIVSIVYLVYYTLGDIPLNIRLFNRVYDWPGNTIRKANNLQEKKFNLDTRHNFRLYFCWTELEDETEESEISLSNAEKSGRSLGKLKKKESSLLTLSFKRNTLNDILDNKKTWQSDQTIF